MYYKIVNKILYKTDQWGNPNLQIADNVQFATYDDKTLTFLVTKFDGKVELRNSQGNLFRIISNVGLEGRFESKDIILRMKDGKTGVFDRDGNLRRYL
jgi:hypothetical protein